MALVIVFLVMAILFESFVLPLVILIVYQALYHLREEGMAPIDAIEEAIRNRIRPILTSTLTSIGRMLPLGVCPGEGSELYRGLGAVVVGGLSMLAFVTLLTVPPLLRLTVWAPLEEDLPAAAPAE